MFPWLESHVIRMCLAQTLVKRFYAGHFARDESQNKPFPPKRQVNKWPASCAFHEASSQGHLIGLMGTRPNAYLLRNVHKQMSHFFLCSLDVDLWGVIVNCNRGICRVCKGIFENSFRQLLFYEFQADFLSEEGKVNFGLDGIREKYFLKLSKAGLC